MNIKKISYVFEILKNERNVTNFGCVFLIRFYITYRNYLRDRTNNCTVIAYIFFQKWNFNY